MMTLPVALTFLIGIGVRLAVPLGITIVLVALLRRLDARWQAEAEQAQAQLAQAPVTPCWEAKGCSPEQRATCPAFRQNNIACWQVKRLTTGRLPDLCLECAVFRNAPAVVPAPVAVRASRPAVFGGKSK